MLIAVTGHASRQDLATLSAFGVEAGTLIWLYGITVLFLAVVFVPTVAPERALRLLSRLRGRPVLLVSAGYVTALLLVGSLYPFVAPDTVIRPTVPFQPPVWRETDTILLTRCEGPVVDERCQETL